MTEKNKPCKEMWGILFIFEKNKGIKDNKE